MNPSGNLDNEESETKNRPPWKLIFEIILVIVFIALGQWLLIAVPILFAIGKIIFFGIDRSSNIKDEPADF